MYPVCAMPEYASRRTTCRCWSATRFPSVIVTSESATNIGTQNVVLVDERHEHQLEQAGEAGGAARRHRRNAATGTGAPS